jgi:hypothetical protein
VILEGLLLGLLLIGPHVAAQVPALTAASTERTLFIQVGHVLKNLTYWPQSGALFPSSLFSSCHTLQEVRGQGSSVYIPIKGDANLTFETTGFEQCPAERQLNQVPHGKCGMWKVRTSRT